MVGQHNRNVSRLKHPIDSRITQELSGGDFDGAASHRAIFSTLGAILRAFLIISNAFSDTRPKVCAGNNSYRFRQRRAEDQCDLYSSSPCNKSNSRAPSPMASRMASPMVTRPTLFLENAG